MSARIQALYEQLVLKRPLTALLVVLALALVMAVGLPQLRIDASADSLTLEYDEDLDYFRELSQRYGSSDILVVTFRPRGMDLFSDQALSLLDSLTRELGEIEGVAGVNSLTNVPLLFSPPVSLSELDEEPRTLMTEGVDKEAAKEEFRTSPIYRDQLLGPDGQTTGILATLESDDKYLELVRKRDALRQKRDEEGLTDQEQEELERVSREFTEYRTTVAQRNRERVEEVRALMDNYRDEVELFLGGPSMITADIVDYVANDLVVFGTGVVLFMVLMLAVIFRQLRWVVLPLASCSLAVILMLGWLGWVDWRLTVISSNFVPVLLIVSMALTIHLVVRYRELHWKNPDWPQIDLVRETVNTMARPCLYTALTSMVAFASLVVSNIRPVIDFGWMMTIGLVLAFVLVFVLIPAGMLLWGKRPVRHRASEETPLTLHFSRLAERRGNAVVAVAVVVAVVSVYGISRLQVDNRFIDYFDEDTEIHQGLSVIDAKLGGTTPLDIVIRRAEDRENDGEASEPGGEAGAEDGSFGDDSFGNDSSDEDEFNGDPFGEDPFGEDPFADEGGDQANSYWFTRAGLDTLEEVHEHLESLPEIGKVNSLVTAYHTANRLVGHRLNDFELAFMRQTLSEELNEFLIAPYIDDEREETRLTMRTVETATDLKRAELLRQLHRFMQEDMGFSEDQYRFSGLLVLYNNMLQSLYKSQILTLGAVFLGIMVMFMVLFRSLLVSVIAIAPNLLAAAGVLGGMGLAGVPLDMMTITIAAITVGIGVDYSIHYIHRFRREFAVDGDYVASMHRAHGSIGRALHYTAVIIIFGFSILALSNFVPSIYFGLLTGLAMLLAVLGALALLPKLLLMAKPFGPDSRT